MRKANPVWQFFKSIKLTVVLLISLAATSVIGTVIPQNQSPQAYFQEYGPFFYRLFEALDIFDMYHSWWFQLLMLLLAANIVVCSIDRLAAVWKIIFPDTPHFNPARLKKAADQETFTRNGSPEAIKAGFRLLFSKHFRRVEVTETENGFTLFGEKWRWSRLGVYVVHFSVLLLLFGGMIGSFFGFEGFVNIPEGEKAGAVRLRGSGEMLNLPFEVRVDDFHIHFYDNGMPSEYRSSLSVLEQGEVVLQKEIVVNDPLRYRGINFFQSSFGEMPSPAPRNTMISRKTPDLHFFIKASGMGYTRTAEIGKPIAIPEGMGKFVLMEFRPEADFMGQAIGAAFVGILTPGNGEPTEVLLPVHFPNFDKMRKGEVVISVVQPPAEPLSPDQSRKHYFTGLQVTRDPGVWVVYSGFVVMIIGCLMTFFMSHQQVMVDVAGKGRRCTVTVAGAANKNKLGMQNKIKAITRKLQTSGSV